MSTQETTGQETTGQDTARPSPKLWLRILYVLLLLAAIAGSLAYIKYLQFGEMAAQGSTPPPPISVTVAEAQVRQWQRQLPAIGTLVSSQAVEITSEVAGVITMINFASGEEIAASTLIIELDNRTEMATLEATRAQYNSEKRKYERLLKLKDQGFTTTGDIDNQASLVEIAEAQINVARAALSKKRIFAPFSGRVGINRVDIGEYIAPGISIVSLQSLDSLFLDFTLPESNFNDLAVGQAISFKVRSYPEKTFSAKVQAWNPELDASTRNVAVRAQVDNRERLLAPGMFAEMQVVSKRKQTVIAVPETSIFYNIYGEAAYVLEQPESSDTDSKAVYKLAARQLRVGYRQDGVAGVISGLKAGDIVVTAGQLKLYPSLKVSIVPDVPEYEAKTSQQ
ncbi:MAG: membrane fusion protein (multidrug efflux system) [Gammaproteobacteria bacterium]